MTKKNAKLNAVIKDRIEYHVGAGHYKTSNYSESENAQLLKNWNEFAKAAGVVNPDDLLVYDEKKGVQANCKKFLPFIKKISELEKGKGYRGILEKSKQGDKNITVSQR